MSYFIPIPDNEQMFYAYINMVINNRNNAHLPKILNARPKKIGWVNVTYTRNEVGESFIECQNNKEKVFIEMIIDQFCLLRSHWNMIQTFEQYEHASRY